MERVIKFKVIGLTAENVKRFHKVIGRLPGVLKIESNLEKSVARIISGREISADEIRNATAGIGVKIEHRYHALEHGSASASTGKLQLAIDGMHCRSCEITIEHKFKNLPGVKKVEVDAATGIANVTLEGAQPSMQEFAKLVAPDGYKVHAIGSNQAHPIHIEKPTFKQLIVAFGLVFVAGSLISRAGFLDATASFGASTTFWTVFVIGLVAASSSCIAVSGGLLLSAAAKFNERYGRQTAIARMEPVSLFVLGRLVSYAVFGGLIGLVGRALTPSPVVLGLITILAATYMLIMGLDMLHLAPRWLLGLLPRLPKVFGRKLLDAEGREHPFMPFALGAGTFFLPCGFTQALQLYALTTGSAVQSALLLFSFALGTAPALLLLGFASGSLKGRAGQFFFRFSGALVIVLGLWNIQNGLTASGFEFSLSRQTQAAIEGADPNVTYNGKTQIIQMQLSTKAPYYTPANSYTVKAGVPVRIEIGGDAGGCRSIFQIPKFNVQVALQAPKSVVEFVPDKPGPAVFSCSMGMYKGTLNVVGS